MLAPEVRAALDSLLAGARGALGERFLGLYVYGSLATGDFDPDTSDIDFVVVTEGDVGDADVAALAALHAQLNARGDIFAVLEGSYIPRAAPLGSRERAPERDLRATLRAGETRDTNRGRSGSASR